MASAGENISYTVSGRFYVTIQDIITEYGGKKLSEGIVRYHLFQSDPQIMTLPLNICRKLKSETLTIFEFKNLTVTENINDTHLIVYASHFGSDDDYDCDVFGLFSNPQYAAKLIFSEPDGNYGLDCDDCRIQNVSQKEWFYTPDNNYFFSPDHCYDKAKEPSFTAEFVKGYDCSDYEGLYDTMIVLRDGKPEMLKTKAAQGIYENLEPGKQYRFTYKYWYGCPLIDSAEPV